VRLYGLVFPARVNPQPVSLTRLDPLTLSPVGRPSVLGRFYGLAVPSPDERRVALVAPNSSVLRLYEGVRLVRLLGLGTRDEQVRFIVWTAPDRLVAIVQRMSQPYARYVRARYAVGVDAARGRVLFRTRFDQRLALTGWGASQGRVALLYQSSSLLARRSRLTVISPDGTVRSARLHFAADRTLRLFAGLAVDPSARRAYAVLSGGRVAVVDLRSLRVAYHVVRVLPGAARRAPFVMMRAAWVNSHTLVVSGLFANPYGVSHPAGLSLVDTRTWRGRVLDRRATTFAVARGTVFTAGAGVTAYRLDGSRRYHLLGSTRVSQIQIVQGRAHAWLGGGTRPVRLGVPPPERVVIFGPASGVVFGRATVGPGIRVALLDPNGY